MNPMKTPVKSIATHVWGVRARSTCFIRVKMPRTSKAPAFLKGMEPFMETLNFLAPLSKAVSTGIIAGVATWKFQSTTAAFQQYNEEHFSILHKQIQVEAEKNQLIKEIAATHSDLAFFLKMWRKSMEGTQHGNGGVTDGPLKSQNPKT